MPRLNITLSFINVHTSAQVGDTVYYTPPPSGGSTGGFDSTSAAGTIELGVISSVGQNAIVVEYNSSTPTPPAGSYITFAKDKRINTSSLLGYYASVKFVNNSTEKAELFSAGPEISLSSK